MHTTTVRTSDQTWRDVREVAREDGVRPTRWVADAIVERLAARRQQSAVDELRRQVDELRARVAALERGDEAR